MSELNDEKLKETAFELITNETDLKKFLAKFSEIMKISSIDLGAIINSVDLDDLYEFVKKWQYH